MFVSNYQWPPAKKKCCTSQSVGLLYDILAQIISILDVTTDIIICIQYYQNDRMVFFGISAAIIILAFIAYDIAFVYTIENETEIHQHILMFMTVLPFSPFVPYLLYFIANDESCVADFLESVCCFEIDFNHGIYSSKNVSKLRQFMEDKLERHLGFIIEALVEGKTTLLFIHLHIIHCIQFNSDNI